MKPNRYPLVYLAYGANVWSKPMAPRCPTAVYIGNARLLDHELVFRGVADVVQKKGAVAHVAVWEIQAEDEKALDRFEGYPIGYGKRYAEIVIDGRKRVAMFYVMTGSRRDQYEPPQSYENTLRRGYEERRMPMKQIDEAIRRARQSEHREKRYRGKWVKRDEAASGRPLATKEQKSLWPAPDRLAPKPKPGTPEHEDKRRIFVGLGYPDWYVDTL